MTGTSPGWPGINTGANRQVGESQEQLLRRALASPSGQVMIDPKRENAAWCAMKRMVRRGLFERQEFGEKGALLGVTVIYQITDRGRDKIKEYDAR